jgi:hypothetical protein
MCAAANGLIYRVTTEDGSVPGSPWVEYWYDMTRQIWSGPHTFPASCIAAYNNTFIVASRDVAGSLWQSDYVQSATSTFVENGTQLTFTWTTSMLPDVGDMSEHAMIETTIYMALESGASYLVLALNQNAAVLLSSLISNSATQTIWGQFNWGQAQWGGAANNLFPQRIAWPEPLVFRRLQLSVQGNSSAAVSLGLTNMKYEKLGYIQQSNAA